MEEKNNMEKELRPNPENSMQRSIEILSSMNACDRFEQDPDNENQILLLYKRQGQEPAKKYFSVEELFQAVDYYYENRDSEWQVDDAIQRKDGVVNVYTPFIEGGGDRGIVVGLKNFKVPQILEFAYLLLRERTTAKPEENSNA